MPAIFSGLQAPPALHQVADLWLAALDQADGELSVHLCDDAEIAQLNQRWRQVEGPTDVLSFPQEDPFALGGRPDGMPRVLGDVVISVQTAQRQAEALGHEIGHELRVLLVHGLLHLLGHDHHTPDQAAAMQAEEARLLDGAGLIGR